MCRNSATFLQCRYHCCYYDLHCYFVALLWFFIYLKNNTITSYLHHFGFLLGYLPPPPLNLASISHHRLSILPLSPTTTSQSCLFCNTHDVGENGPAIPMRTSSAVHGRMADCEREWDLFCSLLLAFRRS